MSEFLYIPSHFSFTFFMTRQVPGLPNTTAARKKQAKKNKSGIDGRIMDPIARCTAQRAAKAMRLAAALHSSPSRGTTSTGAESEAESEHTAQPTPPVSNPVSSQLSSTQVTQPVRGYSLLFLIIL